VTNAGSEPFALYLRGRTITFDVTVVRVGGPVVWRRLEGATIPAILQVKTLAPGEDLRLAERWPQRTNGGEPVGPGDYEVRGTLPTDAREPLATPTATLRIVP
jgi:hypothetical protein